MKRHLLILWQGKIEATSTGTMPSNEVNPMVIKAMQEKGIDMSQNQPKPLKTRMIKEANNSDGMQSSSILLSATTKKAVNWELEDPKDNPIEKVRQIRDEIKKGFRS